MAWHPLVSKPGAKIQKKLPLVKFFQNSITPCIKHLHDLMHRPFPQVL